MGLAAFNRMRREAAEKQKPQADAEQALEAKAAPKAKPKAKAAPKAAQE